MNDHLGNLKPDDYMVLLRRIWLLEADVEHKDAETQKAYNYYRECSLALKRAKEKLDAATKPPQPMPLFDDGKNGHAAEPVTDWRDRSITELGIRISSAEKLQARGLKTLGDLHALWQASGDEGLEGSLAKLDGISDATAKYVSRHYAEYVASLSVEST